MKVKEYKQKITEAISDWKQVEDLLDQSCNDNDIKPSEHLKLWDHAEKSGFTKYVKP